MKEYSSTKRHFGGALRQVVIILVCLLILFTFLEQPVHAAPSVHLRSKQHQNAPNDTAVLTFHNDLFRSGQNLNETILTPKNVNVKSFGKRASYPVDGQVYAQPLFVPNVGMHGTLHNVVYVATENDSVYAFDADKTGTAAPLWRTSFIRRPAVIPVPAKKLYLKYKTIDLFPQVGITSTPVIDQKSGTLYVVAFTLERGSYVQRLHGLDIATGRERHGSPVVIRASMRGRGYDSRNGVISFRSDRGNQRAALLLYRGVVYICWAAFGDTDPYHGWIIGYNATTYRQVAAAIYNDSADGQEGGIWMSGAAPAVDKDGYMYLATGNGDFNLSGGGRNSGDSFIKLSIQHALSLIDYFTPFNQTCLDGRDSDLGSGGVLLLPDQPGKHPRLLIGIGKEGRVYVIEREHMGHFTNDPGLKCNTAREKRTDIDKIVQELPPNTVGSLFGVAAYWSGAKNSGPFIYVGGFRNKLRAIPLSRSGVLASHSSSAGVEKLAFSGATPSVSSNGNVPGTGIVWINSPSNCFSTGCAPKGHGALRAYDAMNLGKEIYNSEQNAARDRVDSYVKFSVPTVANGEVFVATGTRLNVYGLLA
jgi:hypothetical protein